MRIKAMKLFSKFIIIFGVYFVFVNSSYAVTTSFAAGNARITLVDSNWGNEGRFAVFVEGDTTSPCGDQKWILFSQSNLPTSDTKTNSLNFSLATTALVTNKRIQILGVVPANGGVVDCANGTSIRIFSN